MPPPMGPARGDPFWSTPFGPLLRNWNGPNLGKWKHYFEVYERHFSRFRHTPVVLLEIGLKNGGSLALWRRYFGSSARIFGADIYDRSVAFERNERYGSPERIIIGDQGDPRFWAEVRNAVPGQRLDIIIDDGSHIPAHMAISLQNAMQLLRPGGVYLCEDVHGSSYSFVPHVFSMLYDQREKPTLNTHSPKSRAANSLQAAVFAVSFYPYLVVVEKTQRRRERLVTLDLEGARLNGSRHNWGSRHASWKRNSTLTLQKMWETIQFVK